MTKPCYPSGSAARSKVCGTVKSPAAASPSDYAWYVNFNNGNANWNNQDNQAFVRAVRASEYRGHPSFRALHTAWRAARRGKCPSRNQLAFDANWIDGLLELERRLTTGTWNPGPSTCFIAEQPKAREIHAPDFADRIVHHWVVPHLEAIYEPRFIFDSYSNRKGKGTHAAVERLRTFVHQVHSGQGGGWYLQLDVANFFVSIHRPTLYGMLMERMTRHGLPFTARLAVRALLEASPADHGVAYACSPAERAKVPDHKRLDRAPAGCGIAIGNLSSQFFANVYLDRLDQFVKHELKVPRYIRYVDDFVLVHHDREQLQVWLLAIEAFLRTELRLELKAAAKLRPLTTGVDFLGYVVYPTHTVVRRRVIAHALAKLASWERRHVRRRHVFWSRHAREEVRPVWASYKAHFRHANSWRLQQRIHQRFPWLAAAVAP